MSQPRYSSYAELTNPSLKDAINKNCLSTIHLATLVAEFAQEMAKAYESFAREIQKIVTTFRVRSKELRSDRQMDIPSTIYTAWEYLVKETELDAQAHVDASGLIMKNVYEPLLEVAQHKHSQALKLQTFRDNFEELLMQSEQRFDECERLYMDSFGTFKNCGSLDNREGLRHEFHNAHNDYILQIRASNRLIDEFQVAIPQILEIEFNVPPTVFESHRDGLGLNQEMDEIYIDTSNTINVAIESHSLLLLTKANEQQRQLENLLKCCRQVNPQMDISYFVRATNTDETTIVIPKHKFSPADHHINAGEESIMNHLIIDRVTESVLRERRTALQREALELASYIKQNQDITHTLVNICQRNLANHLYAKVYETQEDMCRKRNEIRVANLQLGAIRAQIELLTPKQNGTMDDEEKKNPSMIRGMWRKAFKTLKSSPSVEKLTKKSSFHKKKQNSKEADEEVEQINPGPVDPVYSLLKCAADLPRSGGKSPCMQHAHCSGQHGPSYSRFPSGGDSSGNTSKTSSPSSSASHSPKTRRKKLNARMKSFSLDTPEPPKQLLGIDETTKKKSSSFTNTCFGGKESPEEKTFSAANLRKKFAFARASSLEMDEKKRGSYSPSPKESPKSQRKEKGALHVALYNFKAKEKDDIDLRAGWRVHVTDSSKKDWWKGKSHGKSGYFPATYVIPIQAEQRVFQVLQALTLSDGNFTNKFHKDQIVLKIEDGPTEDIVMIRAANNRQALCPLEYLHEL